MPPKKTEKAAAAQGPGITEVERVFLELQIAECNRKNARLLGTVNELEVKNEELQAAYEKLDEDRADIIAYLKKTLNAKIEENLEFKDKLKALEELREQENEQFRTQIATLEKNFKTMKDQLSSENKLLAGKLNTLEEFRAIKDDLMQKFENQELAYKEQEMKYKRLLYEAEKKFVIGKDKLKKEMEARLLKLAQDFQDATELRIAASTHRVIRENIAISNELDSILQTQSKIANMNERFKESERSARIAMELAEEERDKAINKNVVQLKVIDQLTNAFEEVKKEKALYHKKTFDFDKLQAKIQMLSKENENLLLQTRILEQNLHARMTDQNKTFVESTRITKENSRLRRILRETAAAVNGALKLDEWASTDPTRETIDRQTLLAQLLEIVTQYRDAQHADSVDTLASFTKIYEEGDLGFVPKSVGKKTIVPKQGPLVSSEVLSKVSKEKSSTSTVISVETSLGSLATIPSVELVPPTSQPELTFKDSLPSYASSFTSETEEEEVEEEETEGMTDIEKQLAASKLEVQKSFLKDLAASMHTFKSGQQLSSLMGKSGEVIKETDEEGGKEEAEPEEGEEPGAGGEEKDEVVEEEQKQSEEKEA